MITRDPYRVKMELDAARARSRMFWKALGVSVVMLLITIGVGGIFLPMAETPGEKGALMIILASLQALLTALGMWATR